MFEEENITHGGSKVHIKVRKWENDLNKVNV